VDSRLREQPGIAVGDMAELIAVANMELERLLDIVGSADSLDPGSAHAA
jgi:hypothetical protein